MKIYLAGVIGGGTKKNEIKIIILGTNHRLQSYHYKKETIDIFTIYKENRNENRGIEKNCRGTETGI